MQIFRRMEAADVEVDVVAYNSAIAACAKGGDWEQAWAVFSSKWLPVCICTVKPPPVGFTLSVLRVDHISQKNTYASADTGCKCQECVCCLSIGSASGAPYRCLLPDKCKLDARTTFDQQVCICGANQVLAPAVMITHLVHSKTSFRLLKQILVSQPGK